MAPPRPAGARGEDAARTDWSAEPRACSEDARGAGEHGLDQNQVMEPEVILP